MAFGHHSMGHSVMVPIPANLRHFFTVSEVAATIHGHSRAHHPRKPHKVHHSLHGARRAADPWKRATAPTGR